MDKEAVLSWLAEIHRLKHRYKLEYPNVPTIGHFVMFSKEFHWNSDCHEEMVQLGNASNLHFFDYFDNEHAVRDRQGSCGKHPALVERSVEGGGHWNQTSWGHSPEHSTSNYSASSPQSSLPPESIASNEFRRTNNVPFNCRWQRLFFFFLVKAHKCCKWFKPGLS